MPSINSPVDLLKILEKSNCRDCGYKTCLAFAAAVFNNQAALHDCPRLAPEVIEKFAGGVRTRTPMGQDRDELIKQQKEQLRQVDLNARAEKLGAVTTGDGWRLPVLGKEIFIDENGELSAASTSIPGWSRPCSNWSCMEPACRFGENGPLRT